MISANRKAELQAKGFYVEDMEREWGSDFECQYRWINRKMDDFGGIFFCEEDAWTDADNYFASCEE